MKDENLKKNVPFCTRKKVLFWRQFIAFLKIQQKNRFADVDICKQILKEIKRKMEEKEKKQKRKKAKKGKEYKKVIS